MKYCVAQTNNCVVPGCSVREKLERLPFTQRLRWGQWLKMCPFLLKYSLRQLNDVRICRNHFIPEHIDQETDILNKYAIPLLHLPAKKKGRKILEINPIELKEPVYFKVVTSTFKRTENTNTDDTIEKLKEPYRVYLKAEDTQGLPVDHDKYCLPSRPDETPACLSSTKLASSDSTAVKIEAGQEPGAPVDHNACCETSLPNSISDCLHFIKKERMRGAASRSSVSVASQTDAVSEHLSTQLSEQFPDHLTTDIKYSVKEEPETGIGELLLDSQVVSHGNTEFDNNDMHNQEYGSPTDTIPDESAHSTSQEQSAICLRPNDFNQLPSKSLLEKENAESIKVMFSNLKEKHSLPFNRTPIQTSEVNKFSPNRSKPDIQPLISKYIPTERTMQSKHIKKQTLESLVAELIESVNGEEIAELQPSAAVMTADTPAYLLNPTSDTAPCPQTSGPPVITEHPLAINTTETKFRFNKENSTERELILQSQLIKVKAQARAEKHKTKLLKAKLQKLREATKHYLKGYQRLTPATKELIDMQLRLAGVKSKAARYTDEEKLFAVRIHQLSPECYRFLRQYLKLPVPHTMTNFLKNP